MLRLHRFSWLHHSHHSHCCIRFARRGNVTVVERYRQFEGEYPKHVVLMQVGDFFEIYGAAVEPLSRLLDIAVARAPGKATDVPMTGFPVRSFDTYVGKLVRAGHAVVVAEQNAVADVQSGRFDRQVTRVITPGTVIEEHLLDRHANNFILLLSVVRARVRDGDAGPSVMHDSSALRMFALAWMDVSTGDFFAGSCDSDEQLAGLLSQLNPREVLLALNGMPLPEVIVRLFHRNNTAHRHMDAMDETVADHPEQLSASFTSHEVSTAQRLLKFVRTRTMLSVRVKPLERFGAEHNGTMAIDADSFRSLDVLANAVDGGATCTLFSTLNECKTALGARLLTRRLQSPMRQPAAIRTALDRVERMRQLDAEEMVSLRRRLAEVGDIERILQRLCLRRPQGVARDLRALARSLQAATAAIDSIPFLAAKAEVDSVSPLTISGSVATLPPSLTATLTRILDTVQEKPPLRDADGGVIRPQTDPPLDELRRLRDDTAAVFADLASRYRASHDIPLLRIVPLRNQHVIEVPRAARDALPPAQFHLLAQTETKARFMTAELASKCAMLQTIHDRIVERELAVLDELRAPIISDYAECIRATAATIAQIDLDAALAVLSLRYHYTRPEVLDSGGVSSSVPTPHLEIVDGRHPVLDRLFVDATPPLHFTPNSICLPPDTRFMLLTGPNMGGKSTFLRQCALIVLMAQCGSFVPAHSCRFTPVDAIFTRIGASDNLSRDQSTFMLEMTETARILRHATAHSLVVVDEIGRGTSATEGLALAAAITRHLVNVIGCRTLFATHYHELSAVDVNMDMDATPDHHDPHARPSIQLACTSATVREDGSVILVPKVQPGVQRHSFALPVAALAGIPERVVRDARLHLARLCK